MNVLSKSGIYRIVNNVNGRFYIGSAAMFLRRFDRHRGSLGRKTGSYRLQKDWDKYGREAFSFEPLIICEKHDLLFYEQRVIDAVRSFDPAIGYNILPKAGRLVQTPEVRKSISSALKGVKKSAAHVAKMSAARAGISPSPKALANMRAASKKRIGIPRPLSTRLAISAGKKGHTVSAATRAKLSAAKTGKPSPKRGIPVSEAERRRLQAMNVGRVLSPEHRAAISASLKAAYESGCRPKLKPGTKSAARIA